MSAMCSKILLLIFLAACSLISRVESQSDVHLDCRGPWIQQTTVTIVCTIDRTSYPSKCTMHPSTVTQFRVSRAQSPYLSNCSVPDFSTCAPSASLGCHCTTETAAQYTLEYRFIAHQDYEGSWECNVPGCLQGPPPILALSPSQTSDCTDVSVDPPTTTPLTIATTTTTHTSTTQTTTPPPPPPCWCVFLNPNNCVRCQWICILLIVFGIVLLCVGTAVVLWLFACKKERLVFIDPGGNLDKAKLTQCAQSLTNMESDGYGTKLKNIEKQAMGCCTRCPVSILVDGQYSINKTDGIQIMKHGRALHVMVTCRNYVYVRRAVKMIKSLIAELPIYTNRSIEKGGGPETAPASKIWSNAVHPAKYTGSSETNQTNDVRDGDRPEAEFNTAGDNSQTARDGDSTTPPHPDPGWKL